VSAEDYRILIDMFFQIRYMVWKCLKMADIIEKNRWRVSDEKNMEKIGCL